MKVNVIQNKGETALIEWEENGRLRRSYMPAKSLQFSEDRKVVEVDKPHEGIEYGDDLAEVVQGVTVSKDQVVQRLHQYGIWTLQDFADRQADLRAAYRSLTGEFAAKAIQRSSEQQRKLREAEQKAAREAQTPRAKQTEKEKKDA